jgi:hypothetical protein
MALKVECCAVNVDGTIALRSAGVGDTSSLHSASVDGNCSFIPQVQMAMVHYIVHI